MKPNAVLVNVARAEIVDEAAIYKHLRENPSFTYATDVWNLVDGAESYSAGVPLLKLDNFIGTPHVSCPSASASGEPMRLAIENLLRYLRGEQPKNVVDRSEYT
jgi:phosphoglycerate dehydrogenase-like enzyme